MEVPNKIERRLEKAVDSGTAMIFLNQLWISRLAEILQKEGLLDKSTEEFIIFAKEENKRVFNELNEIALGEVDKSETLG